MKSHGFTLIELLITISIIALLSAIGFVVYRSVLEQGRDAKRQADLKAMQSALEQYRADVGNYPPSLTFGGSLSRPSGGTPYMNIIPTDPTGSPQYNYTVSSSSYCLYANLENSTPPDTSCANDATRNFEVTPP